MGLPAAYIHDNNRETKRKKQFFSVLASSDIFASMSKLASVRVLVLEKDSALRDVLNAVAHAGSDQMAMLQSLDLLTLSSLGRSIDNTVHNLFRTVVAIDPKTDLSLEEISEIFRSEHPEHFIIGSHVDHVNRLVVLYRGNLQPIIRSFDSFVPNATAKPNFKKLRVIDGGLSIELGKDYEASTYSILYETDSAFRKQINKQRKREDRSFGPCLFRARKIMGLSQSELGVPRETIHRIENDKIGEVQERTKKKILNALDMTEEELLGY